MAPNFPGPFEVRINYTTNAGSLPRSHQLRLSMNMNIEADPGDPFSDWTAQSRLGATPQLDTWVDALVALIGVRYPAATSFVDAELWEYDPGTFNAAFRSSYSIGAVGTSMGTAILDGQEIYTFRSQNGGSARLNLMEAIGTPGQSVAYPNTATSVDDIMEFITDLASPVIARDNGYLFAPLNWHPGFNERLFKKRYRNL